MDFSTIWSHKLIRKWGKYIITILAFGVVYFFVGDQSIVCFIERGREIRRMEKQTEMYNKASEEAMSEIRSLNNIDSLERFAREQYFMHEANEDIYLVEEP
jgi:cell division protein FtsB